MISRSPDRHSFSLRTYREVLAIDPTNKDALAKLEIEERYYAGMRQREDDPEWQKDNMEYDLRSTDWILAKVRASDNYAQNLYAALCNNDFQHNDVWPILSEKTWSCSWRYAGGVIAEMQQKGDYIDWYCSGIVNEASDEEYRQMTKEQQEAYLNCKNNFVSESVVTDEIREDLLKLGWIVLDQQERDY
jgi:hypothetical protein